MGPGSVAVRSSPRRLHWLGERREQLVWPGFQVSWEHLAEILGMKATEKVPRAGQSPRRDRFWESRV